MKTDKRDLFEALRNLNKIISAKSHLEILSTVKLESHNGILNVIGTNLNNTVSAELPCEGADLSVCVNAKQLQQILKPEAKTDDADTVTMTAEDDMLTILCSEAEIKLPVMSVDDFPEFEESSWELAAVWPSDKFLDALKYTSVAACSDTTRQHICCVCISEDSVVATNGRCLHKCAAPTLQAKPMLLRLDTVNILLHVLKLSDNVIIARSDLQVKIKVGSFVIRAKLVDDEYPPYEQVIPKNQNSMLKVETAGFLNAMKRVLTLSGNAAVKMTVNGVMELSVNDKNGFVAVKVPLTESKHDDDVFVAAFDAMTLLAAVPKDSTLLTMTMDGSLDPLVICDEENQRKAVIMPMRI